MSATKSYGSLTGSWASGSTTTSGTTTAVSTSTYYSASVYVKIVQVGVPTTAATFIVQQSPDGTNFYDSRVYNYPLAAATYTWGPGDGLTLAPDCESVQIVYTAQSGGTSSTLTAQLGYISGV